MCLVWDSPVEVQRVLEWDKIEECLSSALGRVLKPLSFTRKMARISSL